MGKIKILLADTDEKYLMPLERKFIDGFEDHAEINVITDGEYLKSYFNSPQSLDILVINEELYNSSFERHNIANVFILTENMDEIAATSELNTNRIYKYTSVNEIFNEVRNNSSINDNSSFINAEDTRVLLVYSPIGGIGKTTIASGLSATLAKKHKRVLFIGVDSLQSFGCIMKNPITLKNGIERLVVEQREDIYQTIKPFIVSEQFSILPPFTRSLSSLNIKGADFIHIIECIKASKDYDFIVVDSSSEFTEETSKFMVTASNIIIVVGQDKSSTHKLDCLLTNIDYSDSNRFIFICNKYLEDHENELIGPQYMNKCRVSEYINLEPDADLLHGGKLLNNESMQKIAFMFL